MKNKIAIISPMYFPQDTRAKLFRIQKTLDLISDNAGVHFDFFTCIDGLDAESKKDYINIVNSTQGVYLNNKKIISNESNQGLSVSLNKLLAQVDDSYTHICTIDLDVQLPPNWLRKCVAVLDQEPTIGVCGVLVEDYLKNNIERAFGFVKSEPSIQFTLVPSIGGACLVFRCIQLKNFGYSESLRLHHIDAYILSKFMTNNYHISAILDRGYHPKELYESTNWMSLKTQQHQEELPKFYELLKEMQNEKRQ